MMNCLLLNHIKVQNANAIAGFTWGFPAITHFLGFTHNLQRKINAHDDMPCIRLNGCGVISHYQDTHTFGRSHKSFTQYRYQPYLQGSSKKSDTPPIIEEGKMNMTVSLLIAVEGNIGNQLDQLLDFIKQCCFSQKLAGGTILKMENITVTSDEKYIKRKLLPGYVLMDRSEYLKQHHLKSKSQDNAVEFLHTWLDFSILKQSARPRYNLIVKHLSIHDEALLGLFNKHLASKPYQKETIPEKLNEYFEILPSNQTHKKLNEQWSHYYNPTEKSSANWEYLPKPFPGFLVPIMTGYKAISKLYENHEVANTRDNETPVCFVEAAHSIGEWKSPHRIKKLTSILWHYHYEEDWYLCKQEEQKNT